MACVFCRGCVARWSILFVCLNLTKVEVYDFVIEGAVAAWMSDGSTTLKAARSARRVSIAGTEPVKEEPSSSASFVRRERRGSVTEEPPGGSSFVRRERRGSVTEEQPAGSFVRRERRGSVTEELPGQMPEGARGGRRGSVEASSQFPRCFQRLPENHQK